jgi:hypothetical protein
MIAICQKCIAYDVAKVVESGSVYKHRTLHEMRKSANHFKNRRIGRICSYCGVFSRNEEEYQDFSSHRGYEQFLKKPLIKAKLREQI